MALSVTMVSPWITTSAAASASRTPCASLTLVTASRPTITSLSLNSSFPRSPLLHSSFRSSSLSGLLLGLDWTRNVEGVRGKRRGLVVRAGKAALCQTKRSRSRKSLARTHGFRRRMRTPGGRAILKRRRAKGRKILCTKTHPNSGK